MSEKEETQEFNAATLFLEIQARLEPAQTTAEGQIGSRKYKYAPLPEVKKIAMQALEGTGVTLIETITPIDGSWGSGHLVCAQLIHAETGVLVNSSTIAIPPRDDMQDLGKCITYARRYNIVTATGMVTEDDDDAAGDKGAKKPVSEPQRTSQQQMRPAESQLGPVTVSRCVLRKKAENEDDWSRWAVEVVHQNGNSEWISTFDEAVADTASEAAETKRPVTLEIKTKDGRSKISAIRFYEMDGSNTDDGAPF